MSKKTGEIRVGKQVIALSSEDRVLFPEDGITKGDIIRYYSAIAPHMIPHVRKRRLTLERFHTDIRGDAVYQKEIPKHFPAWVHRVTVAKSGGTVTHVVCNNAETLVYLVNQGCLTPHVGLQRIDRMEFPDQVMWDLDPPGDDFEPVRKSAQGLRDLLQQLELPCFVKTTGSRGLHVVVPLDRRTPFDAARSFAVLVAGLLVRRHPDQLTTELYKRKRGRRVFLDTNRNSVAQTAVPAFAVRAQPGAPVSMPISWNELDNPKLTARSYTIRNACARIRQSGDAWRLMARQARSLGPAANRLARLLGSG
jgi:bifunctional non-homologous end joining protein LigD